MSKSAARVLEDALGLPAEERAALAATLLDSLDREVDEGSERAWAAELAARAKELEDGAVAPVPWAAARRAIVDDD